MRAKLNLFRVYIFYPGGLESCHSLAKNNFVKATFRKCSAVAARENMTKESIEQTRILETIDKKEENMKQVINSNNTQKNESTEEKKPVKNVK